MQTISNQSLVIMFKEAIEMALRIRDGKIELYLDDKPLVFSELNVSDGFYHIIEIIKDGKSWTLKIDGVQQQTINGSHEEMRNTKIFIGGYPHEEKLKGFAGEIKDIFINNELVSI